MSQSKPLTAVEAVGVAKNFGSVTALGGVDLTIPTGTIPELPLVKRSRQTATAKLAIFAYDRASGQLVWSSGTMLDQADTKNVFVGGFGPIKSGSIQNGSPAFPVHIEGYDAKAADAPRKAAK